MNPRLSMNVMTTKDWDLGQCVDAYARLGFPAIGLTRAGLEAFGVKKGIQRVKDAGLKVASCSGLGPYSTPDPKEFKRQVESAPAFMDIAAELRADCVYVMSGARGQQTWESAAARFAEGLHAILPAARQRGVRLAVEPVHPMRQDLTFLNTAKDTFDLIRPLDPKNVGYVFDFYHCWWERGILETVVRSAKRMFAVQLSDHKARTMKTMDRAMLGEGIMPLASLLRAVERGGYKGYYDIEIISDDVAAMGNERALRQIIKDFDALWEAAARA